MIRTYDGRRAVIPSSELFTNSALVNTAFDKRGLEYDVGIGFGDDTDHARQLMLEAVRRVDGVLDDPVRMRWWSSLPSAASISACAGGSSLQHRRIRLKRRRSRDA